jgi:Kef-type K+ transport system membrane component KefB
MLLVGLTIDPLPMRRELRTIAVLVAAGGTSMALLALLVVPYLESAGGWKGPGATSLAFLLALAAALAAQGVPIVARILEERELLRTRLGAVSIATGACVTTLALLASGVAIKGGDGAALGDLALVLGAAALLVAVLAPLARSRWMTLSPHVAVAVLLAIALAAGAAGKALFGTVLIGPLIVGVAVRNAGFSAVFLEARLGTLVRGVLLPVFLAVAALHTNLRELHASTLPVVLALIAAVVVVKLAASYGAARAVGFEHEQARALGALLQCGGVMTIAVSLDALGASIITTRTHALLTLVGIVTTLLAGPLLSRAPAARATRAGRSAPLPRP